MKFPSVLWAILLLIVLWNANTASGEVQDSLPGNLVREKIYMHIDRYTYYSGETIWFKVYLVNSKTHRQELESKVVYVELLNPEQVPVLSQIIKIDKENGTGDFLIPADLQTGDYIIRAYTRSMMNYDPGWFFHQKIHLITDEPNAIANRNNQISEKPKVNADLELPIPKTALQFFPDGGYMVNDFINQVAFKAVDRRGRGIDVKGTIVDQSGNELMNFQTRKFGLGVLNFAPHKGQSYKVHYTCNGYGYECDFPVPIDSGAVMQLIYRKDHYSVIVGSSLAHGTKGFRLIVRQRNKIVTTSKLEGNNDGAKIDISKKMLETGVAQFTLLNEIGLPLCERLVFVEPADPEFPLKLYFLKKEYSKDDSINLVILRDSSLNSDVKANLSLSVSNSLGLENPDDAVNIQTYLWLASELKGEIEHPSYYLFSPDPDRKSMLDLLMMTQGWRQFIINDTIPPQKVKYKPEKGLCFRGHVKKRNESGQPAKANVSLFYSNKQEDVYYETTTDKNGYFAFEDIDFADSTKVVIQVKKAGEKEDIRNPQKNFVIVLDSLNSTIIGQKKFDLSASGNAGTIEKLPSNTSEIAFQVQKGDILIDEVLVTEKKKDPFKQKRTMYSEPSHSVNFNEIRRYEGSSNLLEVLKQRTSSRIFNGRLSVGGDSTFLYLLNGMPVSSDAALSIPTTEIDFVDILEGPKTIIYGSSGANGVIAIYTLNGFDMVNKMNGKTEKCILNFTHPGFAHARKFYQPAFPITKSVSEEYAEPLTIYWKPSVNLDDQNRVSFHAPQTPGVYHLTLEGVTSDGGIIHSEVKFDVK